MSQCDKSPQQWDRRSDNWFDTNMSGCPPLSPMCEPMHTRTARVTRTPHPRESMLYVLCYCDATHTTCSGSRISRGAPSSTSSPEARPTVGNLRLMRDTGGPHQGGIHKALRPIDSLRPGFELCGGAERVTSLRSDIQQIDVLPAVMRFWLWPTFRAACCSAPVGEILTWSLQVVASFR